MQQAPERLGRVDGIRKLLTMLRQASARSEGASDADTDERGRLGRGPDGVPGGAAAAGRQGPGRPQVSESASLFHRSQHTWRALPAEFGDWNAVWKRFWRLSRSGVFEAMFEALAATSTTAHLVQMLDSTTARAHVSAAGSKGGRTAKLSAARAAASRPRSISRPTSAACRSPST